MSEILGHLGFLPVDEVRLRRSTRLLLPYRDGTDTGDREKEMGPLLDYPFLQYERNRETGLHDGPLVTELGLYRTT